MKKKVLLLTLTMFLVFGVVQVASAGVWLKFSWRLAIKEFFLIVVLAFLVGGAFNQRWLPERL